MIENLAWDSDFFGLNVGRYKGKTLRKSQTKKFLKEAEKRKFDCVYVFLDPSDYESVAEAGENKFFLSDIRSVYELPKMELNKSKGSLLTHSVLSSEDGREKEEVIKMSKKLSSASRFYFDPIFRNKAKEIYAIWAEKIINNKNGAVILNSRKGRIVGFTGCELDKGVGEIVLVYVGEKFRGQGFGEEVVKNGVEWLIKNKAKKIMVKTQVRNVAANRLYQKAGFRVAENNLIYHVWRKK